MRVFGCYCFHASLTVSAEGITDRCVSSAGQNTDARGHPTRGTSPLRFRVRTGLDRQLSDHRERAFCGNRRPSSNSDAANTPTATATANQQHSQPRSNHVSNAVNWRSTRQAMRFTFITRSSQIALRQYTDTNTQHGYVLPCRARLTILTNSCRQPSPSTIRQRSVVLGATRRGNSPTNSKRCMRATRRSNSSHWIISATPGIFRTTFRRGSSTASSVPIRMGISTNDRPDGGPKRMPAIRPIPFRCATKPVGSTNASNPTTDERIEPDD